MARSSSFGCSCPAASRDAAERALPPLASRVEPGLGARLSYSGYLLPMSSTRTPPSPKAASRSSWVCASGCEARAGRPRCWRLTRCVPSGEAPACPITVQPRNTRSESPAIDLTFFAPRLVGQGYASLLVAENSKAGEERRSYPLLASVRLVRAAAVEYPLLLRYASACGWRAGHVARPGRPRAPGVANPGGCPATLATGV